MADSLELNLRNLIIALGTDRKEVITLITGLSTSTTLAGLSFGQKTSLVNALNELKALVDQVTSGGPATPINDNAASTTSVYSSSKVTSLIQAVKDDVLGGVTDASLDTLKELGDLLKTNGGLLDALTTALGKRLRFDAAQTLTAPEKVQGAANLGVPTLLAIGDVTVDLAVLYASAKA